MTKLFSIKKKYSEKILRREKLWEFRRTNVNVEENEICLIYSSGFSRELSGFCFVKKKLRLPVKELWEKTKKLSGITKKECFEYFKGCIFGTAILFKKIKKFSRKIELGYLKKKIPEFRPPQSYYNINKELRDFILRELRRSHKELNI